MTEGKNDVQGVADLTGAILEDLRSPPPRGSALECVRPLPGEYRPRLITDEENAVLGWAVCWLDDFEPPLAGDDADDPNGGGEAREVWNGRLRALRAMRNRLYPPREDVGVEEASD